MNKKDVAEQVFVEQYIIPEELDAMRADVAVSCLLDVSRSAASKLFKQSLITRKSSNSAGVNGEKQAEALAKSDMLYAQDEIFVQKIVKQTSLITPADIEIIFEDSDIVVVNKPVGMAAHTAEGWQGVTVLGALLAKGCAIDTDGEQFRRGIVHRLDVGTTGVMVVAKTQAAYDGLKTSFAERRVEKIYHAIVQGYLEPSKGTIDAPIGRNIKNNFKMAVRSDGKAAVTHYQTLETYKQLSFVEVSLETGRTHQIRVHMQAINHPVIGDGMYGANPLYAKKFNLNHQCLHARSLSFTHPISGEKCTFTADYPQDLQNVLSALRS